MRFLLVTAISFTALLPTVGVAADDFRSIFSFDAFGTLGVVHSDEHNADFSGTTLYPYGAGHSERVTAEVDSLIGGQVTANISDRLTGVVQVISKRTNTGDFDPEVEWANIRYEMTPELSIRLGRAVLPSFIASTYRNIGYANHWVRAPIEVYGLIPLTSSDGITAIHTLVRGNLLNSLEITYGGIKKDLLFGNSLEASNGVGISNTLEIGDLVLHGSYHTATLDLNIYNPLLTAFRSFGDMGAQIVNRYDPSDSKLVYSGIGASYDPGLWFVMAEWGQTNSDSILGTRNGAYISVGRRFGTFTPFLTLAAARSEDFPEGLVLDPSVLPAAYAPLATSLNQSLSDLQALTPIQDSVSIGARWELNRRLSFAVQFDHSNISKGSFGYLNNQQPDFETGSSLNLISASLSFVFP